MGGGDLIPLYGKADLSRISYLVGTDELSMVASNCAKYSWVDSIVCRRGTTAGDFTRIDLRKSHGRVPEHSRDASIRAAKATTVTSLAERP